MSPWDCPWSPNALALPPDSRCITACTSCAGILASDETAAISRPHGPGRALMGWLGAGGGLGGCEGSPGLSGGLGTSGFGGVATYFCLVGGGPPPAVLPRGGALGGPPVANWPAETFGRNFAPRAGGTNCCRTGF